MTFIYVIHIHNYAIFYELKNTYTLIIVVTILFGTKQ